MTAYASHGTPSPRPLDPTTLWLDGTERADGYDPAQQLGRRLRAWLDDLVLHGALGTEDRRSIRIAIRPRRSSPGCPPLGSSAGDAEAVR